MSEFEAWLKRQYPNVAESASWNGDQDGRVAMARAAFKAGQEPLRELTADAARWLVLNRRNALEIWLHDVPASVVRRTALAAMGHDAALAKAPPAEVS